MDFSIPNGLFDLLKNVTIAVLRERPRDLYEFVADYFVKIRDSRRNATEGGEIASPPPQCNHDKEEDPGTSSSVPLYIIVDDDELAVEPDKTAFKPKTRKQSRNGRRGSVSAERYDPETDAANDAAKVFHPKTELQQARLTETVKDILLFRSLESELMTEVIGAMFEKKVAAGEVVIRQGDDGDNFYVIESGVFDVFINRPSDNNADQSTNNHTSGNNGETSEEFHQEFGQRVLHFEEKGSFGELALMYNMPRAASVVAITAGTLWAMDRQSFRRIVLLSAFRKRKLYESLLESVPMLQPLDSYERMSLADALVSRLYSPGERIIREGDTQPDGMYFIEKGQVKVTITTDGKETEVKRISAGQYFGEIALLDNSPRTASVYAMGEENDPPVKLAFLERQSFERLLGPCLDIMKRNTASYILST